MSTRSVIARTEGDGFVGRYCHWDGYPTNRGAQLFAAYRELDNDAEALRKYAIREGESGTWSSFQVPSELTEFDRSTPEGEAEFQKASDAGWTKSEGDDSLVNSSGDDWGTEWAYVIEDRGLLVFDRRWGKPDADDGKMVGMFGQGADAGDGYWKLVGTYTWDAEPDWGTVGS
jgi:hypothetical protein